MFARTTELQIANSKIPTIFLVKTDLLLQKEDILIMFGGFSQILMEYIVWFQEENYFLKTSFSVIF